MDREEIGLNDAYGRAIRLGDIVEFWACSCSWHSGGGLTSPTKECPKQRRFVDYVYKSRNRNGKIVYAFCQAVPDNGQLGGTFAWRHNKGCRVVGALPEDAALLVDALAFPPIGTMREQIIDQVKRFKIVDDSVLEVH